MKENAQFVTIIRVCVDSEKDREFEGHHQRLAENSSRIPGREDPQIRFHFGTDR